MMKKLKQFFCRHKEQYPARIGTTAHWQCAKCDSFCGVIGYNIFS